jgi:hypothetical protein
VEALIVRESDAPRASAGWPGLNRAFLGIVIACAAALFVPGMFGKPDMNPWNALSILMIFASYGLFRYIEHGNRGWGVCAIMVGLILFDLSTRDWTAPNRIEVARSGVDRMDQILSARPAAQFLKAQPGVFRVLIQTDPVPNIGDLFQVPMIQPGGGATLPIDAARLLGDTDLLNVRYILTPATEQRPGAIYQDRAWKVYQNPSGYPRAWTVHETMLQPSTEKAAAQLGEPGFDARRIALAEAPVTLEPLATGAQESASISAIAPNRMELDVDVQSRGLLVLSENYYPGWRATVDGQTVPIYRVDGGLRGVIVPRGHTRVALSYAPRSVYWGGLLSLMAFAGTLVAGWIRWRASARHAANTPVA